MGFEIVLDDPKRAYKKCILIKSGESLILEVEIPAGTRVYFSGTGSLSPTYGLVDKFKIIRFAVENFLFGGFGTSGRLLCTNLRDPVAALDFLDEGKFCSVMGDNLICSNLPIKVFWTMERASFYFI